jgi:ribokinase
MSGRVIVVGSVNVDLVVRAPRLPSPGETVTGGDFERHQGGKGGNQAIACARLGHPTLFVGAVGDDPFATEARGALAVEHVDVSRLFTIPGRSTGVAVIMVDARGENLIGVAAGANADLEPAMVAEALGRLGPLAGDVVMASNEVPTASVREALRVGRAAGATTILNPAPAGGLDADLLRLADVMTPNRTELAILAGHVLGPAAEVEVGGDPVGVARRLVGALRPPDGGEAPAIVVTLAAAGARIVRVAPDGSDLPVVEVPAPVVEAVDSTGAGDAFNGALAVAIAERRTLDDACRRAVAAGALATTKAGAREGMPTARRLREFLGEPEPLPPAPPPPPETPEGAEGAEGAADPTRSGDQTGVGSGGTASGASPAAPGDRAPSGPPSDGR